MMRLVIICGLVFGGLTAPVQDEKQAKIISFVNDSDGKGNYNFSFETSNGIFREETGTVMNEGQPDQYIYVQGSVSFPDSEGIIQKFHYVADNNGYEILPPDEEIVFQVAPNVVATLLG